MIYICPPDDYDDLQRDWNYVSWPGFNAYQSQEAIKLIGEGVGGLVIIYFYVITREIGSCSTTKNGFKSLIKWLAIEEGLNTNLLLKNFLF